MTLMTFETKAGLQIAIPRGVASGDCSHFTRLSTSTYGLRVALEGDGGIRRSTKTEVLT